MASIGVISDTHGLLRPEAENRLAGAGHILHAGDVGAPDIVGRLRRIAPVTAVRGNVDTAPWAAALPDQATVRIEDRSILVLHDLAALAVDPAAAGHHVVVHGHSHRPSVDWRGGVLFLNPGSAGRRRFRLPVTVATLEISVSGIDAVIHTLEP